jgi:hypothetical protein
MYCAFFAPNWAKDGYDMCGDIIDDKTKTADMYSLCGDLQLMMDGRQSSTNLDIRWGFNKNVNLPNPTTQKMLVSLPVGIQNPFEGKTLTYWEYTGTGSRNDPVIEGPIYDVKYFAGAFPDGQNGVMITRTLQGQYPAGVFKQARLSQRRLLGDVYPTGGDGKVDLNDYGVIIGDVGKYNTSAKISNEYDETAGRPDITKPVGLPDLKAGFKLLSKADQALAIPPEQVISNLRKAVGAAVFDAYMQSEFRGY